MSADPLRYFRVEARELIDQISAGVLDLDQQPGAEQVARLLRFAHTLKGAARVVRQQEIADRAHAFEEVLVPHRSGDSPLPADEMRELLRLNDEIEDRVAALEPAPAPIGDLPGGLRTPGPPAATGGTPAPANESRPASESRPAGDRACENQPDGDRPGEDRAGEDQQDEYQADAGWAAGEDEASGNHIDEGWAREDGAPDKNKIGKDRTGVDRTTERRAGGDPADNGRAGGDPADNGQADRDPADSGRADRDRARGDRTGGDRTGLDQAGRGRTSGDQAGGDRAGRGRTGGDRASDAEQRPKPVQASVAETAPAARAATADIDELLDAVGEAHARFAPLRTGGLALEQLIRSAEALAGQLRIGRTAAQADAARTAAVRLATDLGALGRRVTDTVEQVERELDEVRGRAERLRLVSASNIFTALHRAVRDAADAQGRRVRFEGRGGELRLDPHVLTLASSALLHVVRNAVVHGIEDADDRVAAGKPAEGTVVVEVQRRGRFAAFRCTDDGRGFDLAAVRRTAEARGLLMAGGTPPDEQTLVDLVLRGGISTSPTVTEVAGRGIGLDVARDVTDQLGGCVSVSTNAGRGATVELVLPLALLSLHGLIVEAAGTVATIPLDTVRTCVRLLPEQAAAATGTGKMAHDGEAILFLPLARALYAGTAVPDGGGPTVAVIVDHDGDAVAVGVDRLAGTSTLVVRPLPDLAPAAPVIGGVSMDLDGNPRLVLDAQGLIEEAARFGGGGVAAPESARRLPILVVDDSLTTRMLERSILESAGYEVDLAASAEEGLERARAREYGLFLTDIDMPGIDGFTFVAETRADPELSSVPAILVSSRSSAEDRQRGVAVGASAYVVKGEFNQEELLAHIRRLVPA